jgi:hypothetical protein
VTIHGSPRDSDLRGALSAADRGVRIQLAARPLASSPLVVHGVYRVAAADVADFQPPAARGVVVVVQRNLTPFVATPFRERVLFDDDVVVTDAGIEGAFTLDVREVLGGDGASSAGRFHIFVSLGPHVSNVLQADVTG